MPGHIYTELLSQYWPDVKPEYIETIQSLWSGYGELFRVRVKDQRFCVKYIQLTDKAVHPRGWDTDIGHQRKLLSYQVETNWYAFLANTQLSLPPIPSCVALIEFNSGRFIIMDDLENLGYSPISETNDRGKIESTIEWLAIFHAAFMVDTQVSSVPDKNQLLLAPASNQLWPEGVWRRGTYWHLSTRPDEFAAMQDSELKQAAADIDRSLSSARFQTLVHGDAKLANFCYRNTQELRVAAVDFQYTGVGIGVQDLAYFLGSVLDSDQLSQSAPELLDYYLSRLSASLQNKFSAAEIRDLNQEYRQLFPVAWADFDRFLAGWAAEHPKLNAFSAALCDKALKILYEIKG